MNEYKLRKTLYIISTILVVISLFIMIIEYRITPKELSLQLQYGIITNTLLNRILLLILIEALIPIAVAEHIIYKRYVSIDDDLPMFLSTLSDTVKAGMDFVKAWETSCKGYTPVRNACKKALGKLYLGVDFAKALDIFADELRTKSALRVKSIIFAAYTSGGKPGETLDIASKAYMDLDRFRRSRLTRMAPFMYISYMSIIIFLIAGYILIIVFFPATYNLRSMGLKVYGSSVFYESILFYGSIIVSISSALLSSKLSAGSIRPGIKHIVVMFIIIYISFFIFIEGGGTVPLGIGV